ncbi:MAG: tyrosine-type recombinase/integrase [Paracoccaceae bacterium]|nr:tyrosine-type recombinase/integrase [Paracoccaceae bacterium]
MKEFDRLVRQARRDMGRAGSDNRTSQDKWHEALFTAAGLKAGVSGLEDATEAEIGELTAQSLPEEPDPLLKKALAYPSAPLPEMTLGDAFKMYWHDMEIVKASNKRQNDLKRVKRRLREALGDIDKLPLQSLSKTSHRRQYRDSYINYRKRDGEPKDGESMQGETNIVVSVLNQVRKNTDEMFSNDVFSGLPWPEPDQAKMDKRPSLPDEIVDAMTKSRQEEAKNPVLRHVWALSVSTGALVSEFASMLRDNVKLDDPVPHVFIRPNAAKKNRKTKTSVRQVPLTNRAQAAMRELLRLSEGYDAILPRYVHETGNTNLSAAIMNHVKKFRGDNTDLVAYGLRHWVSDKMRDVGAPESVRRGYTGHAMQEIAENTYGGREARLREFAGWAEKAGL